MSAEQSVHPAPRNDALGRWARVALLTIAAAGAAWILTRHANHALRLLPYALLLACPLMHVAHHGRHRHGGHKRRRG